MKIAVFDSSSDLAVTAADMFTDLLNKNPEAVIGLATGSSPLPVYEELIKRYKAGEVSFAQAKAFLLDEYVGMDPDHPETYQHVIDRELAGQVNFAPGAVRGPDGTAADAYKASEEYDQAIQDAGGVDLQILGIGTDGHIAFNMPGGSLSSKTHPQVLTKQTREDNARFFDGDLSLVPTLSITQGLATISKARKIVLVAQGAGKADAVKQLVEGGVSALWPATILQFHNDTTILLDEAAASKLVLRDHYKNEWEAQ